jgi:hypothetical protein
MQASVSTGSTTKRLLKTKLEANQNAKRKRLPQRRNFMLTKMLAEKERLIFLPELLRKKRQADFENLAAPTVNKAEATKQSESKPLQTETQAKNLEASISGLAKVT